MSSLDAGEKACDVARVFMVSEKTLYLWRRQRKERGHCKPITNYQKGHSHKLLDLEQFCKFAFQHSALTTKEMAEAWGSIGVTVIKKGLKMIGFTRKKRPTDMSIATSKSERFFSENYQK